MVGGRDGQKGAGAGVGPHRTASAAVILPARVHRSRHQVNASHSREARCGGAWLWRVDDAPALELAVAADAALVSGWARATDGPLRRVRARLVRATHRRRPAAAVALGAGGHVPAARKARPAHPHRARCAAETAGEVHAGGSNVAWRNGSRALVDVLAEAAVGSRIARWTAPCAGRNGEGNQWINHWAIISNRAQAEAVGLPCCVR